MGVIVLIDGVLSTRRLSRTMAGPIDEVAHVLTTALFLTAWRRRLSQPFVLSALAATVLLDVDHLPRLRRQRFYRRRTRPKTHSLLTVLAAAGSSALLRGRAQSAVLGAASGVGLHLLRDLGFGTIPLAWPIAQRGIGVPYGLETGVVFAIAARISRHAARDRHNVWGE